VKLKDYIKKKMEGRRRTRKSTKMRKKGSKRKER